MVLQVPWVSRPPFTEELVPELMTIFSAQCVIFVAVAGQEREPRACVITLLSTLLGLRLNVVSWMLKQVDSDVLTFLCSHGGLEISG